MVENRLIVEIDVDPDGKASAKLRDITGDVHSFAGATDKAGQSGLKLRDVFAGNLLSDFFQRGASAAVQFGAASVQAAAAASDANRQLEFSATQAGLSYTKAAELAESFGKRVGASNAEAARTYADIIRLAERAGRGADVEKLGRGFADLAAARGIKGAELSSLIGTILSGQDEGLNRLGADDPSKLNAAYAASIGKVAEQLGQREKAAAAVYAVEKLMEQAQGESERRLRDTAGQLDTAAASWENFKVQMGDAATTSVTFRDILTTVSGVLDSLTVSHEEARRELAKGLKSPEQLAREAREGTGMQIWNAGKGILSAGFALSPVGQLAFEYQKLGRSDEEIAAINKSIYDSIFNPGQRGEEADRERFRGIQRDIREQEAKARQNANRPNVETPDAAAAKKAVQEAEKAYKAAIAFVDDIAARTSGRDNPFIALFTQGETAAERMQERFGALGAEVVKQFTEMERKALSFESAAERIHASLRAVELDFQAEQLQRGYIGVTAEQQRQLGVLQKQFDALRNVPDLLREAAAFERGFTPQNDFQLAQERRGEYERIRALRPSGTGEAARAAQKLIDDYILERTKSLPVDARFSSDPFARQLASDRAGALRASAGRFEAEIKDEMERARAGRAGVELAERKLKELAQLAPGADADLVRKEFLEIAKALDPKELTGALREATIYALKEEAQHQRELEREAKAFREQLVNPGGILHQIKDAIDNSNPARAAQQAVKATAQAVAGEEAGDVVRIDQKYYPSKEAYEAAKAAQQQQSASNPHAFFGPNSPFNSDRQSAGLPTTAAELLPYLKAQAEGRYVGDIAGLATNPVSDQTVNPYSQEFFRARPGYSPANDPRAFDADNLYMREFYGAGYFYNLHSAGEVRQQEEANGGAQAELTRAVRELTEVIRKNGSTVNINVGDGFTLDKALLGAAPRSEDAEISHLGHGY